MDRQQIARSMTSQYGNFLTLTEVSSYLRLDRGTVRQLLYGVPYLPMGRKKLYNADDVAKRITERSKV